jgi:GNAT superfamily N-acetyltransferase
MSKIEIRKIESKSEIMQFIKFPWKIYKDYPNWVPPIIMDRKKILNKEKNPFFKHGSADYFMAFKGGEPVGRIAAIQNDLHNQVHEENIGFFGFFECIDDQEVANALLDTAKDWIKSRGMTLMRGPASFSSNDEWGLLLEGYDDPPTLLMPYNPPYYHDLVINYGFVKIKDLNGYKIINEKIIKVNKIPRVAAISTQRFNVKIRNLDLKDYKKELELIKKIYNENWERNWGFVPLTDLEMDTMAEDLKQLATPSLAFFLEVDGKPIAFSLTVLDYNQIFKQMNGRLFPFNFLKLWTRKKDITRCRIILLGVIKSYHGKGIDAIMYKNIIEQADKIGIHFGDASWIVEDNLKMVKGALMMEGELYKVFRVYDYAL